MGRCYLLDVNVLIALFDPRHIHHDQAHGWFSEKGKHGWATCPITENRFVRVVSSPSYPSGSLLPGEAAQLLRQFSESHKTHAFWADSVSLLDESRFDFDIAVGHKQITDIYLLGLCAEKHGYLATFDRKLPTHSLKGKVGQIIELIPG